MYFSDKYKYCHTRIGVDGFSEKRDGKSKTYGFPQTDDNTPLGGVIPLRGRRSKGFPATPVKSKG
jgi:hypothetical protein